MQRFRSAVAPSHEGSKAGCSQTVAVGVEAAREVGGERQRIRGRAAVHREDDDEAGGPRGGDRVADRGEALVRVGDGGGAIEAHGVDAHRGERPGRRGARRRAPAPGIHRALRIGQRIRRDDGAADDEALARGVEDAGAPHGERLVRAGSPRRGERGDREGDERERGHDQQLPSHASQLTHRP